MTPTPSHTWHLIGDAPGPCVVVLGGVHGDELTGIEVIKKLMRHFGLTDRPAGRYPLPELHGELFLALGNPEAIRLRQRSASGGRDLNRYFIQTELDQPATPSDPYDLVRARELAPILARANFVFDIHATSNDSPPFVCCGKDAPAHHLLFRILPVTYILTDPKNILAHDEGMQNPGTTDGYVASHGGVAFGYETGNENDMSRVDSVTSDILRLLGTVGSISPVETRQQTVQQKMYMLTHSVQAKYANFSYRPGMDSGWKTVKQGEVIGTYDNGEEEKAAGDGMMLFPKAKGKIVAGKNLYYLAANHPLPNNENVLK